MFSEKLVYSLFLRFLILKNENNIFETLLKSENLTLKFHNSYKNSSPSVKSEQQCSVTSSRQNFFLSMLLPKKSPDFFLVVKMILGLAIRSVVFIPEALVLSDCFNSFIDETGQGTQFPSFRAIFSAIFTHKTTLLEPVTHF